MPELTIGAGYAGKLLDLATARGADRVSLLARAGIDAATLADQDARLPFDRYVALMRAGKEMSGDPALALHFGETVDMSEFSIVGLLAHASETMIDAFRQLNRYGRLVVEVEGAGDRFAHVDDARGRWLVDRRENPNDFPELTESTFARMTCGTRRFGDTPFVLEVHVTHEAPPYRAEYDRIFEAPVIFGSDRNAMLTDPAWATHRVAVTPGYAFGILANHADTLMQSLERSKSVRGRIESLLLPVLHTGNASIESVAAKLGTSRQTLYRQLKAEGTSFERVLDDLRRRMALDYLGAKRVSVNETAYLVGFSDPAAFSRAFKRWTGISPRDARNAAAISVTGKDQSGIS